MYTVKIHYSTGDSESNWEETQDFGYFDTIEETEKFLDVLKQHYIFSQDADKCFKNYKQFLKQYETNSWFVKAAPVYSFIFKDKIYLPPYIGYCQYLISANIVECINSDTPTSDSRSFYP